MSEVYSMGRIAAAAFGLSLSVSALTPTNGAMAAMEVPVISSAVKGDLIKVQQPNCRKWVSICLKRWGPGSPKYGQCLRNHRC
jgi:hypothetical protein